MTASAQPTRGDGLRMLPGVVVVGLGLGLVEGVWHSFGVQPGPGYPGDGGPSWLGHMFLNLAAVSLPALAIGLLTSPLRVRGLALLTWIIALTPAAFAYIDQTVHMRGLEGFALDRGGVPHLLRLAPWIGGVLVLAVPAGWWLGWRLARWGEPRLGPRLTFAAIALALASPWLTGLTLQRAARHDSGSPQPGRPNVVLVTVDTLRLDAVGAFGGPPTPNLDRWIAQGVAARAWSPASWTRPAMGALFSGLPTTPNGAHKETRVFGGVDWWPQRLRDAGYATQAFLTNPNLLPRYGFERGFDGWDHSEEIEALDPVIRSAWAFWTARRMVDKGDPRRGDKIVDKAVGWLRQEAPRLSRPWFLWVHLIDPHVPYHLRGPAGELSDPNPPVWYDDLAPDLGPDGAFHDVMPARRGERVTGLRARAALHELYRREVQFADRLVGQLLDEVAGMGEPTVWILTSDHGEEFWEHGSFEHGHSLHDEILKVPFAIGGPEIGAGGWIDDLRLQDIGPTLLSLLGLPPLEIEAHADLLPAEQPLAPFTLGVDRSPDILQAGSGVADCAMPFLLAEGMLYGPSQTRWLLPDGVGWGRVDDQEGWEWMPGCERAPRAPASPVVDNLSQLLEVWRRRAEDRSIPVDLDPTLIESLRAVGYIE